MKSDQVVELEQEAKYYDSKGFGNLPSVCRVLAKSLHLNVYPFDIVIDSKEERIFLKMLLRPQLYFLQEGFRMRQVLEA